MTVTFFAAISPLASISIVEGVTLKFVLSSIVRLAVELGVNLVPLMVKLFTALLLTSTLPKLIELVEVVRAGPDAPS